MINNYYVNHITHIPFELTFTLGFSFRATKLQ